MLTGIVAAFLHVDIVVQDLEKVLATYTTLFGFRVVEDCIVETDAAMFLSGGATRRMRLVFLSLNHRSTMVEFVQLLDEQGHGLPAASDARFDWNMTFLVTNLEIAKRELAATGIRQVSEEYDVALPKLGKSRVLYCRDSEGLLIELVGPS